MSYCLRGILPETLLHFSDILGFILMLKTSACQLTIFYSVQKMRNKNGLSVCLFVCLSVCLFVCLFGIKRILRFFIVTTCFLFIQNIHSFDVFIKMKM
jgi:hypothetical protein